MVQGTPAEALAGLVERVMIHDSETGFRVLRAKASGQPGLAAVSAMLPVSAPASGYS